MKKTISLSLCIFALALASVAYSRPQDDGDDENRQPGQPDTCNSQTATAPKTEACHCERSDPMNCPMPNQDTPDVSHPGSKCDTFCRPKACNCVMMCGS